MFRFFHSIVFDKYGSLCFNYQADAVHYDDWRYTEDELYIRTYTPSAYKYLTQWYSASDSYIYIPPVTNKVDCDEEFNLDMYFNAEDDKDYTMFVAVIIICF